MIGHLPKIRARSPIIDPKPDEGKKYPRMLRNGLINGEMRINRIELRGQALVEITHVDSPSCFWARLPNHITDQLTISEPYKLTRRFFSENENNAKKLIGDRYFMAPIEDRIFSRVRVLNIEEKNGELYARVIYIDHGFSRWLNTNCLADLPENFLYHPWQVICLAMTDIEKVRFDRECRGECDGYWEDKDCAIFRDLINEFPTFCVRALLGSVLRNDYREPIKVEMYGIDPDEQTNLTKIFHNKHSGRGQSISCLFAARTKGAVRYIEVPDSSQFPVLQMRNSDEKLNKDEIPLFLRDFPEGWKSEEEVAKPLVIPRDEWDKWKPEYAQIPVIDVQWLQDNGFMDKLSEEYWIQVEGTVTQSPYEWYGRPIKRVKKKFTEEEIAKIREQMKVVNLDGNPEDQGELGDITQSMLAADAELKNYAEQLASFYNIAENRYPLDCDQVAEWIGNGKRVYAITCVMESRAMYTGEWQRVEVYKMGEYADVRYLDSGGRETIAPSNLYKIHPRHTTYPPLCLQLCLHGICDPDQQEQTKNTFHMKRRREFTYRLRTDVPLVVNMFFQPFKGKKLRKQNDKPFEEDHVLFVLDAKMMGEDQTVVQMLTGLDSNYMFQENPKLPIELSIYQ